GILLALALLPDSAIGGPPAPASSSSTAPASGAANTGSTGASGIVSTTLASGSAGPSGSNPGIAGPMPASAPGGFSIIDPSTWPFELIPVPEVATDPNEGTTVGLLPVMLFNDEHHQIHDIIAPDMAVNTIMGAGGNFRYLSYPSEDTQWYAIAGAAQNIARHVDLFYSTG